MTLRPELHFGQRRMFQNAAYFDVILAAGGVPLGIPLVADHTVLREIYERCDAILLPGGPDVHPHAYGQDPREDCNIDAVPELDATELPLARWAAADDRPLLGICRGAQLINVALGGTLWQDIAVQLGPPINHDRRDSERHHLSHDIDIHPGTRLATIAAGVVGSNSLHHQAIRDVAAALKVTARSPDGVIEAVEGRNNHHRFLVGVQAHPEELVDAQDWARLLFDEFVASAS